MVVNDSTFMYMEIAGWNNSLVGRTLAIESSVDDTETTTRSSKTIVGLILMSWEPLLPIATEDKLKINGAVQVTIMTLLLLIPKFEPFENTEI